MGYQSGLGNELSGTGVMGYLSGLGIELSGICRRKGARDIRVALGMSCLV